VQNLNQFRFASHRQKFIGMLSMDHKQTGVARFLVCTTKSKIKRKKLR